MPLALLPYPPPPQPSPIVSLFSLDSVNFTTNWSTVPSYSSNGISGSDGDTTFFTVMGITATVVVIAVGAWIVKQLVEARQAMANTRTFPLRRVPTLLPFDDMSGLELRPFVGNVWHWVKGHANRASHEFQEAGAAWLRPPDPRGSTVRRAYGTDTQNSDRPSMAMVQDGAQRMVWTPMPTATTSSTMVDMQHSAPLRPPPLAHLTPPRWGDLDIGPGRADRSSIDI